MITPAKTLAKALARYIGDSAVLAFADGAKEQGQFIVVQVPSSTPIGQMEVRYQNDVGGLDVVEILEGAREIMYSVEVYRDNAAGDTAASVAEMLRVNLHGSPARQSMLTYGLALSRIGAVRDLTMAVDAGQEPRFQFDAFYTTVQSLGTTILSIESIDINGRYRGAFKEHDTLIEVRKP